MDPTVSAGPREYHETFRSVRRAKNVFLLLLLLAILIQISGVIVVAFVGVLDGIHAPGPQTNSEAAYTWEAVLLHLLGMSKFLAPILGVLLAMTLAMALNVSLVGRLGGSAGLARAFFWCLILVALVAPWQNIFRVEEIFGATYGLQELVDATEATHPRWTAGDTASATWHAQLLYYCRFLGYPGVAFLSWLVVQFKFSSGCKRMQASPDVTIRPARPQPAPITGDQGGEASR